VCQDSKKSAGRVWQARCCPQQCGRCEALAAMEWDECDLPGTPLWCETWESLLSGCNWPNGHLECDGADGHLRPGLGHCSVIVDFSHGRRGRRWAVIVVGRARLASGNLGHAYNRFWRELSLGRDQPGRSSITCGRWGDDFRVQSPTLSAGMLRYGERGSGRPPRIRWILLPHPLTWARRHDEAVSHGTMGAWGRFEVCCRPWESYRLGARGARGWVGVGPEPSRWRSS
jgi:hypothetical protein